MSDYLKGYEGTMKVASMPRRISEMLWHDLHPAIRASMGSGGVGGTVGAGAGAATTPDGESRLHRTLQGAGIGAGVGGVGGGVARLANPIVPPTKGLPGVFDDVPLSVMTRTNAEDYTHITPRAVNSVTADPTSAPGSFGALGHPTIPRQERGLWKLPNVPKELRDHMVDRDIANRAIRLSPGFDVSTPKDFLGGKAVASPSTLRRLYNDTNLRDDIASQINELFRREGTPAIPRDPTKRITKPRVDNVDIGYYGSVRRNPDLSPEDNELRRILRKHLRSGDISGTYSERGDSVYIPGKEFGVLTGKALLGAPK